MHPLTIKERALQALADGQTTRAVSRQLAVPLATLVFWRRAAGLARHPRRSAGITEAHRLVLVSVWSGDRSAVDVWRRCSAVLEPLQVEGLGYDLTQWGLLCALDGEPWSLTEAGVQAVLGPVKFAAWRRRTPRRRRGAL